MIPGGTVGVAQFFVLPPSRRTPEARKIAGESGTRCPLFGGAVSTAFPVRFQVVEHSGTIELAGLRSGEAPAVAGTAIGKLAVSKGRQGREAHNIVRLYLANIRLKNAATDVVITAYEPLLIK
ncbi:hypothetical protein ZWY2020_016088 [Hordeum vulgare]|nr:hypothetical protein ZWY2020_016088 [Hordeum vulgare]